MPALKFKIKKTDLAEIPEALRGHYTEQGDDAILQVEGAVDATVHREFRDSNIRMVKLLGVKNGAEAEARIALLKDFDPDAITAEREELATFRAGKAPKLEEMVTARTEAMKKDLEKKLKEATDANKALQDRLAKVLIDDALATAAAAKGVLPAALNDVKLRGRTVFRLEGEDVLAYGEDGRPLYGKDSQPMKMAEWMDLLASQAAHLFSPNQGGGGAGGGAGNMGGYNFPNPWSAKTRNLTRQAQIQRENPQLAARLQQQAKSA